jgi:transcriptional regulator with XRE-family HTH domain
MTETTLGAWLRSERERRGITLKTVADQTKVAAPLLQGLETGDLSRWPGGIYRRAFVRAYASALGLDADEVVRRFEIEHPTPEAAAATLAEALEQSGAAAQNELAEAAKANGTVRGFVLPAARARLVGSAADLTVALVLGLVSAAAGSRLLWPVLLIALYYAIGVILKGTSPMVALLSDESAPPARHPKGESNVGELGEATRVAAPRQQSDRRHPARRSGNRPPRPARQSRRAS